MKIKHCTGLFDVGLNIEDDSLNFQVSYALGDSFNKLLHILYHFYPDNNGLNLKKMFFSIKLYVNQCIVTIL